MSTTILHGHSAAVTGLVTPSPDMLLSCSEDGSIRMWDLRCSGTVKAFMGGRGKKSVAAVAMINANTVVGAVGEGIVMFDTRTDRIVVTTPMLARTDVTRDDISDLHSLGNGQVAFCSDDGYAGVMKSDGMATMKRFKHPGLCTSVRIWPTSRTSMLACGGLGIKENCVMIWDVTSNKLVLSYTPIADMSTMSCNPPHVHSLDYLGNHLFASIGDGSIAFFHAKKDGKMFRDVHRAVHAAATVTLAVAGEAGTIPRLVASAGLDSRIVISRFNPDVDAFFTGEDAHDVIPHAGAAINSICWEYAARSKDGAPQTLRLFVADTSKNITCTMVRC